MKSSVRRRNVSPCPVGRCVGELLAGSDAGQEPEHLAEAVRQAEAGGQDDDRDERDAVREVERVGDFRLECRRAQSPGSAATAERASAMKKVAVAMVSSLSVQRLACQGGSRG